MTIKIDGQILKMITGEIRPAQSYSKELKKWIPTGGEEKVFTLYFVSDDEFKTPIIITTKKDYSQFEGKPCIPIIEWEYDNFKKAMRMPRLVDVLKK